jgi:hypothetical protein
MLNRVNHGYIDELKLSGRPVPKICSALSVSEKLAWKSQVYFEIEWLRNQGQRQVAHKQRAIRNTDCTKIGWKRPKRKSVEY